MPRRNSSQPKCGALGAKATHEARLHGASDVSVDYTDTRAQHSRARFSRSAMNQLYFICIIMTLFDAFLIVYAWTLPLFPQAWRDRVNSVPDSLDPRVNNDSLTGMLIILVTAATCALWALLFYVHLLVPGLFIP